MPIDKADDVLSAYDKAHRAVASHPDAQGLGGALTANAWSLNATAAPLAAAVRSLAATALQRDGRLMLGICANDAEEGVATALALRELVNARGTVATRSGGVAACVRRDGRHGVRLDVSWSSLRLLPSTRRIGTKR